MLKTILLGRGRLDRLRFWRAVPLIGIAWVFGAFALLVVFAVYEVSDPAAHASSIALTGLTFYAGAIVGIRRLHDRDLAGWWVLLALVPIGGAVWHIFTDGTNPGTPVALVPVAGVAWYLFVIGTIPGTPGPNRFGPGYEMREAVGSPFAEGAGPPTPSWPVTTLLLWLLLLALVGLIAKLVADSPGPERFTEHLQTTSLPC